MASSPQSTSSAKTEQPASGPSNVKPSAIVEPSEASSSSLPSASAAAHESRHQAVDDEQRQTQSQSQSAGSSKDKEGRVKKEVPRSPDGIIDMEIIGQVFEMDDLEDEDDEGGGGSGHEFSKGIVWNYFEQAEGTFEQMKEALARKDLPKLSSLGHFLKGSSAALGVIKVKDSCERMQHYGNRRDEDAGKSLSEQEALDRIERLLGEVQEDYDEAEEWLKRYYREQEGEEA